MRSAEIQRVIDAVETAYGPLPLYGSDASEEDGICFQVPGAAATVSVTTRNGRLPTDQYDIQIESRPPGDYIYTSVVSMDRLLTLIERLRGPEDDWPAMAEEAS